MKPEYHAALIWLYGFVDNEAVRPPRDDSRYDLRRVRLLLSHLGDPHLKAKTVHIAGSKGKGSTAAMISAVLREAGYKIGLYTSPHLIETYERFKINETFIGEDEFVATVNKLYPIIDVINTEAKYGELTTFEIMTAIAFDFFAQNGVEWQVVEVGLGGRLDATNVVAPDASVITTINLEHTDVLGSTLSEIATEKAGIIKRGVPVVSAPQPDEVRQVIEAFCRKLDAPLVFTQMFHVSPSRHEAGKQLFRIDGRHHSYEIHLPLLGTYQRVNAAVAVAALETLIDRGVTGIDKGSIERGLEQTDWPGRFQILDRQPLVIADGAHNPASARELVSSLDSYLADTVGRRHPAVLLIGASSDKDVNGMAAVLTPWFDEIVATRTRHPRAMDVKQLGRAFEMQGKRVNYSSTVAEGMIIAVKLAGPDGVVCVTGSLFAVGEALELRRSLGQEPENR